MKIAYLDMPSGISGDMFLGCLVNAGWPVDELRNTINQLDLPSQSIEINAQPDARNHFTGTRVSVNITEEKQPHRHLSEIAQLIYESSLSETVKSRAIAVFERIARAEAKVHGTTIEKVHFHEVGALDSIADIVGVSAGLHALHIDELHASPFPLGDGFINTTHGRMPLPGPATLEIIAEAGAPTKPAPGPGELVTPTGAALVCDSASRFNQPALMTMQTIGVGIGNATFDWPNFARLWIGESEKPPETLIQLDANIDDMTPQLFATARDAIMNAGAIDVWYTPIQMKKNRPATMVSVLCDASTEQQIANVILRETTTLGMRAHPVYRHKARKDWQRVSTRYGDITLKLKWIGNDELAGAVPEYDECEEIAKDRGIPVRDVLEAAQAAAHQYRMQARSP